MPIYQLPDEPIFPPADEAEEDGIIAIGGDFSPERLLNAYASGIFPWPHEGYPLLWFSPDPRMVLIPSELEIARSLRQRIKKQPFEVRFDTAFRKVMEACRDVPRAGQDGTWITDEMLDGYGQLHKLGFAHSAEAWEGDKLVGGCYGVSIGGVFFGESMFAHKSDASKIAFVTLVQKLKEWGVSLVDAQVHTDHLARFGAKEIPRREFLTKLEQALQTPTRKGPWEIT
ncbi:MAG: leucyl/phenylalanyl-tRNA--protein transferase [Planctomycetes bacterium]|nr:leucyl/phenylalanyl-tRNA--protein transferase [Planctomycetota bacterium]